jgi:hypothetical protein
MYYGSGLRSFGLALNRVKIGSSGFLSGCTCKLPSRKAVEDLDGSESAGSDKELGLSKSGPTEAATAASNIAMSPENL